MTSKRKVLQQLAKERKDLLGKIDRLAQFIVKDGPKLFIPIRINNAKCTAKVNASLFGKPGCENYLSEG